MDNLTQNSRLLQEKWAPVLNHEGLPEIKDQYKRAVTAVLLENQEKSLLGASWESRGTSTHGFWGSRAPGWPMIKDIDELMIKTARVEGLTCRWAVGLACRAF